jgi:hypothetical protein
MLFNISLVYDWLYHALDNTRSNPQYPDGSAEGSILGLRDQIERELAERAEIAFQAHAGGHVGSGDHLLQNHRHVPLTGMAAAGFALFDHPLYASSARRWLGYVHQEMVETMGAMGPDGASPEGGAGYWAYGVEYLLKYMHLADDLLGVDLASSEYMCADLEGEDHLWWRNTANFRIYLSLPRHSWSADQSVVNLGDNPKKNWYGPDYLLRRLASKHPKVDGVQSYSYAQTFAEEIAASGFQDDNASWLNLIWYDESVGAAELEDLATLHHFDDFGIVSARSSWKGDEALVLFSSGPRPGHFAGERYAWDLGFGHSQFDANHFTLVAEGEFLLQESPFGGPGDPYEPARYHNTLLAGPVGDLKGQVGEESKYEDLARRLRPRVLSAASKVDEGLEVGFDYMVGDATDAYADGRGIERYIRHLVFLKELPGLIVLDDIRESDAFGVELDMALLFHPLHSPGPSSRSGVEYQAGDCGHGSTKACLYFDLLNPAADVSLTNAVIPGIGVEEIRVSVQDRDWRNAVALTWAPAGETPARVELISGSEDRFDFTARQGWVLRVKLGDGSEEDPVSAQLLPDVDDDGVPEA